LARRQHAAHFKGLPKTGGRLLGQASPRVRRVRAIDETFTTQ
jgi:hypothetical protein